jgi:exo-beta-1,3-glucanase (GH17 family)
MAKKFALITMLCLVFGSLLFAQPNADAQVPAYNLDGLNWSPLIAGQSPGSLVSEAQLESRLLLVKPYTKWIRTYGATAGLEKAGGIAHRHGLKIAMGAWISSNLQANEKELANLIAAGASGEADILIVGSEVILRAENNSEPFPNAESKLIEYIERVKAAVPSVPVTYADAYSVFLNHPNLIAACRDALFVNYFPFWEGIRADQAMTMLDARHRQVLAVAGGKQVVVSEFGWPSDGSSPLGKALPALDNASFLFVDFVSWAKANLQQEPGYFWFEGLDSVWKSGNLNPPPFIERHWGLLDSTDGLKAGMERVLFNNETLPENWSPDHLVDGPGTPTLEFTYVPPYLTSAGYLYGKVRHVAARDYHIGVYINVQGGWWVKPLYATANTLNVDAAGEWSSIYTTGGYDNLANKIAAFVLPKSFEVPLVGGSTSLPQQLYDNAVAFAESSLIDSGRTLDVTIQNSGFSTVTSDIGGIHCGYPDFDCKETFVPNQVVTLTATPSEGFSFMGWSGGTCDGNVATCKITMDSAKQVSANFLPYLSVKVTNSSPQGGSITSTDPTGIDCGSTCSISVPQGSFVTLSAKPTQGYQFSGWSGGGCEAGKATCLVRIDQSNREVSASFTPEMVVLTVAKQGSGAGTVTSSPVGIDCGSTCSYSFAKGSHVTLSAIPDADSTFVSWSGSCGGANGNCEIDLTTAQTVTAVFASKVVMPKLTVVKGGTGNGVIRSRPEGIQCGKRCAYRFKPDQPVRLVALPNSRSVVAGWRGACEGSGTTCSLAASGEQYVFVDFISSTLAVEISGAGQVVSSPAAIKCGRQCSAQFKPGKRVILRAIPKRWHAFLGWEGGSCSGTARTCRVTMDADKAVRAVFSP